jgi:hypothetical protein
VSEPPGPSHLLPALGRVVRGLSCLFWGLPLALVVSVQTARTNWLAVFGPLPPLATQALLLFGLALLTGFQPQERIWRAALDRAFLLGWANLGLSPFLYFWRGIPNETHFQMALAVLALSGVLFLFNLNYVLQRLAAMLPDENLRLETQMFTSVNRGLLLALLALVAGWTVASQFEVPVPVFLAPYLPLVPRFLATAIIFLVLLPLALTMTLLWKVKEVILTSIFTQGQ